jgi:glycine cleavage system H protein
MSDVRYTKTHEWVRVDGDEAVIGITDYAQTQLGDVVYVELPEPGKRVDKGKEAAVVEITAVNRAIADDPARVNTDAEGEGWFFKLKLKDPKELADLLGKADYDKFVAGLA